MTFNELRDELFSNYESGAILDEELLQIIEIAKTYLNLKTITNTATIRCKSYNGIKEFSHPDIVIDKVKFYKNND